MYERDLEAEQADPRRLVDQLSTLTRERRERPRNVVDRVRDVMHSRAALGEKAGDRRVVADRRDELDEPVSDPHRRNLDAVLLEPFPALELRTEEPLVRRHGLVEIGNDDSDVMNAADAHSDDANRAA